MSNSMHRSARVFFHSHWIGEWRNAKVDVDVTMDGMPLEFEGVFGELGKIRNGSMEMYGY